MSGSSRPTLAAVLVVLVAAAVFVATRLSVTTDISQLLPTGADREAARLSRAVTDGEASRTIVLTVEAADTESAVAASRAFEEELRSDTELMDALAFVDGGPPEGSDRALWEVYAPRRLMFAAATPDEAAALVTDDGITAAAALLRRRLASPLSTLITRTAPDDPFLSLPRLFERLDRARADALLIVDGRFVADERFGVVLVGTKASAFDAPAQRAIQTGLDAAYGRVSARLPVQGLEQSGIARFAIRAEETIKADMQRTSVITFVGIALLCLVLLRSFRLVVLTTIPIGCAVLLAAAVTLAIYGELHGITLAFGASLIGVCVDYVVHLYAHQAMRPDRHGPEGTLRRLWPALALGAATTGVGFAVMAGSSFPGLRQVAIFATVGVAAALLGTRLLLPPLLPRTRQAVPARDRLGAALSRAFARLRAARRPAALGLAVAVVATAWGIGAVTWSDDLGRIARPGDPLLVEDERVRERVARFDQGRFVLALGDDEEAALQVNDAVAESLRAARDAGELDAFQGIGTLLPSAQRQRAVDAAMRDAPGVADRIRRGFEDAGFAEAAFAPFFATLGAAPPEPVGYADLRASPAAAIVRPLRMEVDGQIGFVSLLRGVDDPAALAARIEAIDGAAFIDQPALIGAAMARYRERTVQLLLVGLLAVLAVLGWWYRSPRIVAAVIAPAILAAGTTIAVLAATGRSLDLVGLTAILMVLSIGVDYGVFLAETRGHVGSTDDEDPMAATLLGLVVCWASTVLGFGVLALSAHPLMNMIGVVAGVGVTASLVLAPTTLALLPVVPRRPEREAPR